jgi:hypothetical protein
MRYVLITLILLLTICGCSSNGSGILPDEEVSDPLPQFMLPQSNRCAWDIGLYRVSEDHMTIERLPNRTADWHINVNYFVEPPFCNHCLMVGKPQIQPDGTLKVKVILSHPLPGQPQYTGFDVRGTIMFPATRYWKANFSMRTIYQYHVFDDYIPLWFSRAEDGGGQLLNADGFTFYLFPGLDFGPEFEQPIFNYSKGQHAYGPDPDSTVNGFKLFTKDPERRMFLTTDMISRTYHIEPPDGEFTFGYVIDASWVQPTTTPVTDPKTDFPYYANCEEGYFLESEQLEPFKTGGTYGGYYVTRIKLYGYPEATMWDMRSLLFCPDIAPSYLLKVKGVANTGAADWENEGSGFYSASLRVNEWTYDAPPGEYLALILTFTDNYYPPSQLPRQLFNAPLFDFINLEVVQGE